MELSTTEQNYLLREARRSIRERLAVDSELPDSTEPRAPGPSPQAPAPSPQLQEKRGAFVTLRLPDQELQELQLRGCMGVVIATRPLLESVRDSAVSAAFRDPRFPALRAEELDTCTIEISVLSEMVKASSDEIEPGRDGVLLNYGRASGLLLPQVAVEQGWDREQFLDHLCLKAGVSGRCWEEPEVELYRFTASVFAEG